MFPKITIKRILPINILICTTLFIISFSSDGWLKTKWKIKHRNEELSLYIGLWNDCACGTLQTFNLRYQSKNTFFFFK